MKAETTAVSGTPFSLELDGFSIQVTCFVKHPDPPGILLVQALVNYIAAPAIPKGDLRKRKETSFILAFRL